MKKIFFFFTLFLFIGNSWPLTPYYTSTLTNWSDATNVKYDNVIIKTTSGSYNEFTYSDYPILYILNNGDDEGFISPYYGLHFMRLGGATNWSKTDAQIKQKRLQYFGLAHNWAICPDESNCVVDSYLEGSYLSKPFLGIACLTSDGSKNPQCISQGYISAENFQKDGVDNNPGYYHTHTAKGGYTGWGNAFWGKELQNEIRNLSVDGKYTVSWVHCGANAAKYTQELYESGTRCKDITGSDAKMAKTNISLHKMAQLTFNGTNSFEDIFVDTNGSISLLPDSTNCQLETVNSTDGISCVVATYNYQSNYTASDNQYLYLFYDTDAVAKLNNSTAKNYAKKIAWRVNNDNWVSVTQATTPNNGSSSDLIKNNVAKNNGDGTISIFFPKDFLSYLFNNDVNLLDYPDLISFQMFNSGWSESGYYEFLPFTHLNVIAKDHAISIRPVTSQENDESNYEGEGSGIIGSSTPIDIQYKIISSYSDQEFLKNVSLSINGTQVTANDGKQYCAFTDINGTGATIAVPQYVKYQTSESNFDSIETNCKKDGIDLTPNYTDHDNKAHGSVYWEKFDWSEDGSENKGTYARTYIDLVFPMDDSISTATTDGTAFEGKLQSTGTLEVTATWNDVSTSQ